MAQLGHPIAGALRPRLDHHAPGVGGIKSDRPGSDQPGPPGIGDEDLSHMTNWLTCLRSGEQPHATVNDGFAHSVAIIMAARAQREGRTLYWDAASEDIVTHPPKA